MDSAPLNSWPHRCIGRVRHNTQIYEGTNQIQRVVVSRELLR